MWSMGIVIKKMLLKKLAHMRHSLTKIGREMSRCIGCVNNWMHLFEQKALK
jgi:hypothetical protein